MNDALKISSVAAQMATVLYSFLPGSGSRQWTGHVNFQTVAVQCGVGQHWPGGSKEPAIATLLERTLRFNRDRFQLLITNIIGAGIRYRQKNNDPVKRDEIERLNVLILEVGFKFPELWSEEFLLMLDPESLERAKKTVEIAKQQERLKNPTTEERSVQLDQLMQLFQQMYANPNRNAAGLDLEKFLSRLFKLFNLDPRESFRVVGEQIDGSFIFKDQVYLVEAKWEKDPLPEAPLLVFRGKIEGKSSFTRGVFVSLNGYSEPAKKAITQGKQPTFFCMDGYDFMPVLQGLIGLEELLWAKLRCLCEDGKVFATVKELSLC